MRQTTVIKKLELLVTKKRFELASQAYRTNDVGWKYRLQDKAARLNVSNVLPLTYLKTRNYFRNYKDSCGFNLDTMSGHSYGWYSILEKIKGKVVLNTYGYSVQTSKHVRKIQGTLRALGIRFIEIEAPRGLQDLETAKIHTVSSLAEAIVANKYARKPHKYNINHWDRTLKTLAKIGVKSTKKELQEAVELAEESRTRRLERARIERAEAKAKAQQALTLVQGEAS